jgi:dipeptidase
MFMPYQFGFEHPIINQQPDKVYEPDSYWWQQEIMNRLAIFCNNEILSKYRSELFEREKQLLISFEPVNKLTKDEVQVLINEAATESLLIRDKWKKDFEKSYALSNKSLFHQIAWKNFNKSANLKIN